MESVATMGLEDFPPLISNSSVVEANGGLNNTVRVTVADEVISVDIPSAIESIGGSGVNPNLTGSLGVSKLNPNPKDWRKIFPLPRTITPQKSMKYTPPAEINGKLMVAVQTENFTGGIKSCEELVVGFFVGKKLSFSAVQLAVNKLWKLKNEVSIKLHGDCAYIFKFSDEEDRMKALETGSFYIASYLFTVRPWSILLEKSISDIKSVPIWVLIYGVPLHMWNNEGFSLISSYLGKPILADDCTINQTRLAYAIIGIEIDIDFSYSESIPLLIDGKIAMDLSVEYSWTTLKCDSCMVFGHTIKNCSRKTKSRWTPKRRKACQTRSTTGDMNEKNLDSTHGVLNVRRVSDANVSKELETTGDIGGIGGKDLVVVVHEVNDANGISNGNLGGLATGEAGISMKAVTDRNIVDKLSNDGRLSNNKFMVLSEFSSKENAGIGGINGEVVANRRDLTTIGRLETQSAITTCGSSASVNGTGVKVAKGPVRENSKSVSLTKPGANHLLLNLSMLQ